jgi:membrane protein DedA with SNARE-associated domain
MTEEILKAIPIFFHTMLKVFFGPTLSYAAGLHLITSIIVTIAGMMASVVLFTFFGTWLREKILKRFEKKNKKRFTPNNRKLVTLWGKYGLVGVAVLTPLLLTPIGGTLVAVSFGSPKQKIILYMFISATVFGIGMSYAIYEFGDYVMPLLENLF